MVNNKNYSNNRNIQARNTQKEVQVYQRMSKGWHCGKGNAILDRPGEYISTDKAAWASLPKVLGRYPQHVVCHFGALRQEHVPTIIRETESQERAW